MSSLNLLEGYCSDSDETSASTESVKPLDSSNQSHSLSTNFFQAPDEDTSSGDEAADDSEEPSIKRTGTQQLKNPFRDDTSQATVPSLFTNPYREAEDAAKDTLEKHVKFAPKLEDVREINGRKICWNYRKGRCRFGSNCVFAHDSELLQKLPKPVVEDEEEPNNSSSQTSNPHLTISRKRKLVN